MIQFFGDGKEQEEIRGHPNLYEGHVFSMLLFNRSPHPHPYVLRLFPPS